MSLRRAVILGTFTWVVAISLLHGWLNLDLLGSSSRRGVGGRLPFRVGFLPVT